MLNALVPIVALCIPIVAIVGGITAGVVRILAQQKIAELGMKERIAAIERGIDPARLPPLPAFDSDGALAGTPRERALRTAQRLQIAAIITSAAGLGLCIMLLAIPESRGAGVWPIGLIPVLIGAGLGLSGQLVRRNAPPERAPNPPVAS
jgi:hypothetical protein